MKTICAIRKGTRLQYVSPRGIGSQHLKCFTVQSYGAKFTVLVPDKLSLTNCSFKIATIDLHDAIEDGLYIFI